MATHLDALHEAERAVVEAAVAQHTCFEFRSTIACIREHLTPAVSALLALRAATCPACGGTGFLHHDYPDGWENAPCPSGCDNGRKVGV